ncbi:RtcB family protein [Parenemella sanctibonifatiensis]|uniref:3'-phosphate/5'-hydroxy nucleic acid ligase n=1 Tax=Parenemella sanctibonifatiensis TaxID=2016505 RepID=A0A255EAF1_9ACTN|nr:RtcB family protein [Parenemella sanctibonifatiensis]OYN88250.1 RNA-splicing ligase RtcB [Parenemella sanctibonifatiensis]OYN89916.1 RNA-splicing ligase RtcB [Parenemella sanctibonifatiensis]
MEEITSRLLSWASIIDPQTREQAERTARMPFIHPHLALMPDAHLGRGATVGSVIPTEGAIMPAAVGVDIGCGMVAVRTQLQAEDLPEDRARIRQEIARSIPLSAGGRNQKITREHTQRRLADLEARAAAIDLDPSAYAGAWRHQLGSLGSGNHFLEVTLDETGAVWLFLHSGSRGVGNRIATHHTKVAREQCLAEGVELPDGDLDLAYLVEGTEEFDHYIREMQWAQHYALLNREEMMDRMVDQLARWTGVEIERVEEINCHHNYTEPERHGDRDVWLSRKGAISAREGQLGLIPGSMGTASYVVEGLGNPLALHSAPHGAGRVYSRSKARRTFTLEDLATAMVGVEYEHSEAFLDEIPAAYKDIDQVMADAADLVRVRHMLRQIVNVKGT